MTFFPQAAKLRCSTLSVHNTFPRIACNIEHALLRTTREKSYSPGRRASACRKHDYSGFSSYPMRTRISSSQFHSSSKDATPEVQKPEKSPVSPINGDVFRPLLLQKGISQNERSSVKNEPFPATSTQESHFSPNPILLRDACKCSQCVDPSDQQRNFSYAQIPTDTEVESIEIGGEGTWKVRWTTDITGTSNHVSSYQSIELSNIAPQYTNMEMAMSKHPQALWDDALFRNHTRNIPFHDFMNDQKSLAEGLQFLWRYGLLFLDEVPKRETSVGEIAERIGPLRTTFYGPTWDVRSVPQAKNVAFTSKYLGFHMDLLYMRESPAYQLLHCIENTCTGGESLFADTFKAIDTVITEDKAHLQALQTANVRYEYNNDGYYYTDSKPTVSSRPGKRPPRSIIGAQNTAALQEIDNVYWSPPFVGSATTAPDKSATQVREFIGASKAFAEVLERDDMVYETKMDAGTCAIFDNLRVVHARNAFDLNSGKRWLRGAYLDRQDFISRYTAVIHGA